MTGRELIIYILENHLEDSNVFDNGLFLTVEEAAIKYDTGVATIKALIDLGKLKWLKIGSEYFLINTEKREEK